jgi:hypothetical protein
MKRIIITITVLLFSLCSFSQDTTATRTAIVTLPKGSRELSRADYLNFNKNRFKRSHEFLSDDRIFVKDEMLITLHNRKSIPQNWKGLQAWKKNLEAVYKTTNGKYLKSEIVSINGNDILLFEDESQGDYRLSFYAELQNKKLFDGSIQYKISEQNKAHQYLNKLLTNLRPQNSAK